MKKEVQEKWVAALRSGEYKQTREILRDEEGFCCLGVLTDLYIQENGLEWGSDPDRSVYTFDDEEEIPPSVVREWAGMQNWETSCGYLYYQLNDVENYSFEQIADIIEKEEVK
jgi:hypothetical protein